MPRIIDWAALDHRIAARERVLTHRELQALGLSMSTITRRIGPLGPWQRLFPGVVLTHSGTPTRREWLLGAIAFAGPDAVITGADALRALGVRDIPLAGIHVLVPHNRQRKSFEMLRVERSRTVARVLERDGIPYASAARAAIDVSRQLRDLRAVRHVVSSVVQQRVADVSSVRDELLRAARQRTALPGLALREVDAGIRSVAEAEARTAFLRFGVPMPLWNVRLAGPDGRPFLTPDAWWTKFGAGLEIDSIAWHLNPESWRRTQRRQRQMALHGALMLTYAPHDIITAPERFAREVLAFLDSASRRALPDITVIR